jgi:hypothetical protein
MGLNPERSNLDKSAVAKKCSASASLGNEGMGLLFVLIVTHLLLVHKTGIDGLHPNRTLKFSSLNDAQH